jgi:hypothetical protein
MIYYGGLFSQDWFPRLIESGCFEAIISKSASKAAFSFSFIPKVLSE